MPTTLNQATVFTEASKIMPADMMAPLRPHIAGPEGELHRYADAAEKADINVGDYDATVDTTYDYPSVSADAVIDLTSVAVHIDDALLRYFQDLSGGGTTIAPVAGYLNRINTDASQGFKANGATYPRNALLFDRDVAIGDIVHLQDGSDEQLTSVAGLIADQTAAVIEAATSDTGNAFAQPSSNPGIAPTVAATGGGSSGGLLDAGNFFVRYTFAGPFGETYASAASSMFTVSAGNIPRVTIPALPTGATSAKIYLSPPGGTALQCTLYKTGVVTTTTDLTTAYVTGAAYPPASTQTSGTVNDVALSTVTETSYNGLSTGDITETYTIEVTTGGIAASARLLITSASGRDNASDVTPAAFASPTTIGARGLTVTFTHTSDVFVVGQTWQLTVRQAWAQAVPTSGGTFTGEQSVTYIVLISRGGKYADSIKPQITVTTDRGTDSSGPTTVSTAGTNVAVGTLGALIQFAGTGLDKGDVYYVEVTGPAPGAYKTILLNDNLTAALQTSTDLSLKLYLKKNVTVPAHRASSPPDLNWTADANGVTVNSAVDAYDTTLTNSGVQFAVPVEGGTIYINYRAWKATHAGGMYSVVTEADVEDEFGIPFANIVPDHMLAYGVKKAVQNGNGSEILFSGVANPLTLADWEEVVAMLVGYTNTFNLVPLTRDTAVWDAYRTHVLARSLDSVGGEWRHVWFNIAASTTSAIVDTTTSSDHATVLATLGDNPSVSGTQYTLLSVTTGNGKFITNGVMAGDTVRYLFSVDVYGNETYTSFTVASVVNEDSLIFTTGNSVAVTQPQRVEVHRNLSRSQVATNLASQTTGDASNQRFLYVWPDQFTDDQGNVAEGYHLCAIYAAMAGAVAPQQGLRSITLSGINAVPRSTALFNNAQLNTLADAGFVIASQSPNGDVYTLFARTSDMTSIESREEVTNRLDDAIRYLFWNTVLANRGSTNVNGLTIARLRTEVQSAIQRGVANTNIDRIGPMILSAVITRFEPHLTLADRLVLAASITRSFPLNDTTLTMTFESPSAGG
jgi:hypothetical protein